MNNNQSPVMIQQMILAFTQGETNNKGEGKGWVRVTVRVSVKVKVRVTVSCSVRFELGLFWLG